MTPVELSLLERCASGPVDCRIVLTGGGWVLMPAAVSLALANLIAPVDKRQWLLTITDAGRRALAKEESAK